MPILIPSISDVPNGPRRQFLLAMHQLYKDAGRPGIQRTSKAIRARNDLRGTISHEAISKILRGEAVPRQWQKLEALVYQYFDWSVDQPATETRAAAAREIQNLWHRVIEGSDTVHDPQRRADTPLVTPEGAGDDTELMKNQELLSPEEVVSQALKLSDDEASKLIANQARYPNRDLIPLAVALMPVLPNEGILLLHGAGISQDPKNDLRLADVIRKIQSYPTGAWHGHDPYYALLRGVTKRLDCGAPLISLLIKQHNRAAVRALLRVYAQRTSPLGVAELVRALTQTGGVQPVIDEFLQAVKEHTPQPLAVQVPAELGNFGLRREARLLTELLVSA